MTRSDQVEAARQSPRQDSAASLQKQQRTIEPKPLRFGILGAARIVPKALIEPAQRIADVELLAIAARDAARAREFARDHGISRVLPSYIDVIKADDLDAIYIPLPNSLHCEWTIRALRAGKHVLCEKPLAANAREAERMAGVASETVLVRADTLHYQYHHLT